MIEKIQISLYEVFGYLLPGTVSGAALVICYWALYLPLVPFPVYKMHPDAVGWVTLVGVCYVLGHLVQGVGNRYLTGAETATLGEEGSIPAKLREAGRNRAAELMGVPPEALDPASLFRFADEYVIQYGRSGDREIFVYREGLYRGWTISLLVLSGALVIRGIVTGTAVQMPTYIYYISQDQLLLLALGVAIASRICKQRFYRFGAYRVTRAFFAFITLLDKKQPYEEKS